MEAFVERVGKVAEEVAKEAFVELFQDCGIEVAKGASKRERAEKELTKVSL